MASVLAAVVEPPVEYTHLIRKRLPKLSLMNLVNRHSGNKTGKERTKWVLNRSSSSGYVYYALLKPNCSVWCIVCLS